MASFFQLPEDEIPARPSGSATEMVAAQNARSSQATTSRVSKQVSQIKVPEKKLHLILHVDEPDIILVESLENIDSNAIIFNVSIL